MILVFSHDRRAFAGIEQLFHPVPARLTSSPKDLQERALAARLIFLDSAAVQILAAAVQLRLVEALPPTVPVVLLLSGEGLNASMSNFLVLLGRHPQVQVVRHATLPTVMTWWRQQPPAGFAQILQQTVEDVHHAHGNLDPVVRATAELAPRVNQVSELVRAVGTRNSTWPQTPRTFARYLERLDHPPPATTLGVFRTTHLIAFANAGARPEVLAGLLGYTDSRHLRRATRERLGVSIDVLARCLPTRAASWAARELHDPHTALHERVQRLLCA